MLYRPQLAATSGSGQHQIGHHFLALRLGAEEQCEAPAGPADDATDQHRDREPQIIVDGEIGISGGTIPPQIVPR